MSDGWGPLCKFLDVPVPKVPFPNVNDSRHFVSTLQSNNKVIMLVILLMLVASVACGSVLGVPYGVLLFALLLGITRSLDSLAKPEIKRL